MAAGGASALCDDIDRTLVSLTARAPAVEDQAKRLKEVLQKLDPFEAREGAQALVASVQAVVHEIGRTKARCVCLHEDGAPAAAQAALTERATRLSQRIDKVNAQATQMLNQTTLKVSRSMEALRVQVALSIMGHVAPQKKRAEEMFEIADVDRDGTVSREEFVTLVQDCEPSKFKKDQLGRLFDYFDDEKEGKVNREDFDRLIRVYYKVCRPKVELYKTMGISQGQKVRALDIDEVVELVEGPIKEANGSIRVRCKAMKDGTEGWTVEIGNTGTPFLSQCRIHYKVVKTITLTTSFRVDESRTIRALDENELVEVLTWEQLDKTTGIKRLKGKANKDGAIGWVTTVTNTGTKHLEMV